MAAKPVKALVSLNNGFDDGSTTALDAATSGGGWRFERMTTIGTRSFDDAK